MSRDFPAICKYYRGFPADIAENPLNHPVNPCKHLQCSVGYLNMKGIDDFVKIFSQWRRKEGQEFRSFEVREASSLHLKIVCVSKIHLNQKRTINLGIICKNAQIWFCTSIIRKKNCSIADQLGRDICMYTHYAYRNSICKLFLVFWCQKMQFYKLGCNFAVIQSHHG